MTATAMGFVPYNTEVLQLKAGQNHTGIELTMEPGGVVVHGSVADIGGGGVPGALIRATDSRSGSATFAALADEDGAFALYLAKGRYGLIASHPDYVEHRQHVTADMDREVRFKLVPAGVIRGHVIRRNDDSPVAGASVSVSGGLAGGTRNSGMFSFGAYPAVIADAEGAFELKGLEPGTLRISATAVGVSSPEPTEVELAIAETVSDVVVYVDQAFKVSGFAVKASAPTEGISGIHVLGFSMGDRRQIKAAVATGDDGYFEIDGVQPGTYMMTAMGEDAVINMMKTHATVVDKDVDDIVIEIDTGFAVRGRVEPPEPANVTLYHNSSEFRFDAIAVQIQASMVQDRATEQGQFELRPVPRGPFMVRAKAEDGRWGDTEVEVKDGDARDVVVTLEPRATVSGEVVDRRGNPVAGVEVWLRVRKPGADEDPVRKEPKSTQRGGRAITNADGKFVIRGVTAGGFTFAKIEDGRGELQWARGEDSVPTVQIAGTEPHTGIRLEVEAADGRISGVVVGADGGGVADAWVTASLERVSQWGSDDRKKSTISHERGRPVVTNSDGRFAVRNLRAGTYKLVANAPRGTSRAEVVGVALGKKHVTLRLEPLVALTGTVVRSGAPVPRYMVRLFEGDGKWLVRTQQVNKADGTFKLSRLEAGDYKLLVSGDAGYGETPVTLTRADHNVDVTLSAYCSVRGVALDGKTDEPIRAMQVTVRDRGRSHVNMAAARSGSGPTTNDDGSFRVQQVTCGKGQVVLASGRMLGFGGMSARAEYDVADGEQDLGTLYVVDEGNFSPRPTATIGLTVEIATWSEGPKKQAPMPSHLSGSTEYLWVTEVAEDGPASKVEIAVGDRLVTVAGYDVAKVGAEACGNLVTDHAAKAGEAIPLTLVRGSERLSVKLVPTELN